MAVEDMAYAHPLFSYNLLKLVNSPVFNLKNKIVGLKQAVLLPTFDKLAELFGAMPEYPADLDDIFSLSRFEEHSRATALTVQILAGLGRRFSSVDRERYITAALLHDVGRVFLLLSDPPGTLKMMKESEETGLVIENEKKYFGTDHATLGALAMDAAGISDVDLLDAVRMHHGVPSGAGVLVAYADRVVKRFGIGPSEGMALSVTPETQEDLRLKVALEETVHLTVGEVLMRILSEIDTLMISGPRAAQSLAGAPES